MKITVKTLICSSLLMLSAPLYTATPDTSHPSWWDKISAELRNEGSVFKAGQQLAPSSVTNTAFVNTALASINSAGETIKRSFDNWFGSQQDLVADRFKGKPEPYAHTAGDATYTFKIDVSASQQAWATLSDAQKHDYDGSPALVITVSTINKRTRKQETSAPALVGKSRKKGYSVIAL
jgi:hypothetical protein